MKRRGVNSFKRTPEVDLSGFAIGLAQEWKRESEIVVVKADARISDLKVGCGAQEE